MNDCHGAEGHVRACLTCMRKHLPPAHPGTAHMLSILSACISSQITGTGHTSGHTSGQKDRLKESAGFLDEAHRVLCVSYGAEHESTVKVRSKAAAVRAIMNRK
jgi:hypothetical protein